MSIKDYHYDFQTDDGQSNWDLDTDNTQPILKENFRYDINTGNNDTSAGTAYWPPASHVFNDVIYYDMEYLIIKGQGKLLFFKTNDDYVEKELNLGDGRVRIKVKEIESSNLPQSIKKRVMKEMI